MKKILFVALAAVGLTACVQNEELAISKSNAITFDNVYVGNATKAAIDNSYTAEKGNLDHFNVWATISNTNGTANIFKNEAVTKNNAGVWSYAVENTQYWIPGNDYVFVGVVDGTVASVDSYNMPLTISTSLSGQQDVLYDTESRSYNGEAVTPVHFNFEHLLAKVKFTAKNVMTTSDSDLYYTVESIKITNADNEAVYTIADKAWAASSEPYTAEFGAVKNNNGETATLYYQNRAESNYELLVLPQENKSLNIVVNYTLRKNGWASWTQPYEKELTATLDIEKGRAYNFVLELGNPGAPIEFDAEVKDWVETIPSIDNTLVVASAEDFATIAEMLEAGEDFTGKTVSLAGDIDLAATRSASNWTPIGTSEKPFTGTFDGKGYSIKNLTLVESEAKEGKAYIGFFGYAKDATIKNVTFENVNINIPCLDIDHSQGHIGAVAGSLEGTSTIENVTVKGDITVYATQTANGASRVAVVAGGNSYGNVTMKNVHVVANEGSSLIANNNVGALAGQLQGKMVFENCSSNINVIANKFFAGGLVGIAAGDSYIKNCHTTGDVAVVAGREGRHNDEFRVGGIAGGWADGKTKVFTLEGCTYTGNISGKNIDGTVAEPLDYMGYVGRGYTLANCAGSKVVIDGVEFVQKYDNVYGVYTINGCTPVSTTADLQAALAEGKDVILANDLTITPEEMPTAPYGNKMALSQNGGVFNGNGKAISVTANGDNYVLMTNGGTIKNLNIDRGFRGVVLMYPTQDVYVDNVKVGVNDEVCYTINTAEGDGTHSLYVSNSALNGWCSIGTAVKDVTFTNCTFGQGTYYTNVYGRLVKPYVNAVFDGCDFCNKCYLDLSAFVGTKVVVKNCTVNGVKITAENWASLVAPEATCEDGQISVELKNGSYLTADNVADYIVFE